jgi:hypothetical protein
MKWKGAAPGSVRTRTIFAWLPQYCDDGYYRWLCRLFVREMRAGKWKRMNTKPLG